MYPAWLAQFLHRSLASDAFWVMSAGLLLRFALSLLFQPELNYPDTVTYLNYSGNIVIGLPDPVRTPVYPYFIKLIHLLMPLNLDTGIFVAQGALSWLSVFFFYRTASILFKSRKVAVAAALVYAVLPSLINFNKCILTESLSISFLVFFLYLFVGYLKKPTMAKAVVTTLFVFFLVMLRPSFLYLLAVMPVFGC